ncbi:MAG: hypothetical protein IKL72_00890 [Firmicutes bacterium]|nr:hypothetical protein [Bacillota bacterium]
MIDPLGALVLTFIVMSVISVIGIILMFLVKNEKVKNGLFYFMTVWGMIVAYCNASGLPENWTGAIALAWGLGAMSVAALLVQLCMKGEKKFLISRLLVTVSVAAGVLDCFIL